MTNELTTRFPWEPPAPLSAEETIELLKRDFAYAVATTAVAVHSSNPAFRLIVNTPRGQLIPQGQVKFSDGTWVELQDMGMCQPNVSYMSVHEIMSNVWELARELGLEIVK